MKISLTAARALILAGLFAATLIPSGAAAGEPALQLKIPAPSGKFSVGTKSFSLVDHARKAGFGLTGPRRLMVQVSYPLNPRTKAPCRPAPYLPMPVAERLLAIINETRPAELDTAMCLGGRPARGQLPVLIFSHAYTADRAVYTSLVNDLASRGYIVAAVDHTSDAFAVQFPGGQIVDGIFGTPLASKPVSEQKLASLVNVRTGDVRFVLTRILRLGSRKQGFLHGHVDRRRVGILGHSLGGATATHAAVRDRRFRAAADIDGSLFGKWPDRARLAKPFLMMVAESGLGSAFADQSACRFYNNLTGPRTAFQLTGGQHLTFSDFQVLAPQIAAQDPGWPFAGLYRLIVGDLDPIDSVTAQRLALARFFDRHVKAIGRKGPPRKVKPPVGMTRLSSVQLQCSS